MASGSNSRVRCTKNYGPMMDITLHVRRENHPGSVEIYLNEDRERRIQSNGVKALQHLVFCGWKMVKDLRGLLYLPPGTDATVGVQGEAFRTLFEACRYEMMRGSNQESEKDTDACRLVDLREIWKLCHLCNKDGTNLLVIHTSVPPADRINTSPWCCSQTCLSIFNQLQYQMRSPLTCSNGLRFIWLRGNSTVNRADKSSLVVRSYELLRSYFGHIKLLEEVYFSAAFCNLVIVKEDNPISIITFRLHGRGNKAFAELPFAFTAKQYRRQQLLKCLMLVFERFMRRLKVEEASILLPSITGSTLEMWVDKYNFVPIDNDELGVIIRENDLKVLNFTDTQMCIRHVI